MKEFQYLIIGNSAGAVGAVESIRKIDKETPICVVSEERYQAYSRPRISDCITKKAAAETLAYRPSDFYEKHSVETILDTKAVSIDSERKQVFLENGECVSYEKLLLTTGANPSKPPIPGIDLRGVHFFTTFDHAEKLAHDLSTIQEIVIIGGGLIGLQAAEALVKSGVNVTIVEMLDRVLALAVDNYVSSLIRRKFEENGVKILTSACVSKIVGNVDNGVTGVELGDTTILPCQAVIVAAGVTPRTELAVSAGITVNRGIPVDDFMQTSASDVYAAGDVAETRDLLSGESKLTPIWPNAYMEGRTAGAAMAGRPVPYGGGLAMNAAHFFDYPVISAGQTDICDECTELIDSNEQTGFYRRIILKNNIPVGMVMAGDAVDRGGLIVNLIRNRTDVTSFLDKLASPTFNNANLPEELRKTKQLGREKI